MGRARSTSDPATAYAEAVLAGDVIAGPHVRHACQRHIRDVRSAKRRGLSFDLEAADRVYRYFKTVLRLNGGEHEGLPFDLEAWQAFVVGSLFGWIDKRNDGRRFRQAFVETAKGSGKSPLAAGVCLYGLTADGEARAEVYAAAAKKDQAMILFRDAVAMVEQSPALSARLVKSGKNPVWNLAHLATGSFFRPISSDDGQSGPRPHVAALDEIHEHRTSLMVDMLRAGTKKNRRALIFMITNSGVDRQSVCYQLHEYGCKVAAGELEDDAFFAYICACDEGEDPLEDADDPELGYPRSWAKTNPSLPISVPPVNYLREQVREAIGMPAKESIVRRLNFCQWVDALNPWIDGDLWRACEVEPSDWQDPGGDVFLGLDLSSKRDLTAAAKVTRSPDGTLAAELRFWTPRETLAERERSDRVPYSAWVSQGHLIAVPGRSIDYGFVVRDLVDWLKNADGLAFDQWRVADFRRELDTAGLESYEWEGKYGHGIRLVRHGQGFGGGSAEHVLWMPRSITELESAVMGNTLRVRRNPVLTWCSASAVQDTDPTGNKKWEKRKSTGRIDGIVALSMAVGLAKAETPTQGYSLNFLGR